MNEAGLLIQLIIMVICGIAAAAIAAGKGRNAVGWFFGGLLLGLIGVIVVACLSNLKEEREYRRQSESERRRLREQLRQERMKNEAYRRYSTERLDVHDHVLGVDTRTRLELPQGDGAAGLHTLQSAHPAPEPASAAPPPASAPRSYAAPEEALEELVQRTTSALPPQAPLPRWYYEERGEARGPVSDTEMNRLVQDGRVRPNTLIWSEDLGDWTPLSRVQGFGLPGVSG